MELSKLKNENILLKEKEKIMKKSCRELEEERDEYFGKLKFAEKRSEEIN